MANKVTLDFENNTVIWDTDSQRGTEFCPDLSERRPQILAAMGYAQLPMISAQRLFGYRFCSWPRLCTASITRISRERITLRDLAKSDPSGAPPIRPILLNSSRMRFTGIGQWPPGELSANRVSLINRNEKNSDDRNCMDVS